MLMLTEENWGWFKRPTVIEHRSVTNYSLLLLWLYDSPSCNISIILHVWMLVLWFFLLSYSGPKRILRMHYSLKAYCTRPISILTSHFCCQMSLRVSHDTRAPSSERWNYLWARNLTGRFCLEMLTYTIHSKVLFHAVNLRHGTDGFTSPPKEGVLRIFSPLKIRLLRLGLNPRTWVLKANTLPLDHRSHLVLWLLFTHFHVFGNKNNTVSLWCVGKSHHVELIFRM